MPSFNALGRHAFLLPQEIILPDRSLPVDWLEQLFNQLDEYLDAPQQGIIKEYFQTRHLINYQQKEAVKNSLSIIYQKWFPIEPSQLSPDEKKSIAEKLLEAAPPCSEGAYGRVNDIITPWQYEYNLDSLLHQYRLSLVRTAAYKRTNEVHAYNRFFMLAERQGYGVKAINWDDPHVGAIPDEAITLLLHETMEHLYHPLNILAFLIGEIKRECTTRYEYRGMSAHGYKFGDYQAWIDLVIAPLLERELNYTQLLISDNDKVIDLDWTRVALHLLDKLQENGVFNLEDKTLSALLYLMDREQPAEKEFDLSGLQTLQPPSEYFLLLFNYVTSHEKKNQLVEAYFIHNINLEQEEQERLPMLAKIYFHEAIKEEPELKKEIKHLFNALMTKVLEQKSPQYFLKKFLYFPVKTIVFKDYLLGLKLANPLQQKQIIQASFGEWTIVTYAAYHYPEYFSEFLAIIKAFTVSEQEQILFKINDEHRSIFNIRPHCNIKIIDQITQHIRSCFPFEKQVAWCSQHDGAFISLIKQYDQIAADPIRIINALLTCLPNKIKISQALSVFYKSSLITDNHDLKKSIKHLFCSLESSPLHRGDPTTFIRVFYRKPKSLPLFSEYFGYFQLMNHEQQYAILKAKHLNYNVLMLTVKHYPEFFPQLLGIIETLHPSNQEKIFLQNTKNKTPLLLSIHSLNTEHKALFQVLSKLPGTFQVNLYINLTEFFWKYVLSDVTPIEVIDTILNTIESKSELTVTLINQLLQTINNPKSPISPQKKQAVLYVLYNRQPQELLQELDLFSRPAENHTIILNFYQHLKATFNINPPHEKPINVDQTFFALSKVLKLKAEIIKNLKTLQTKRFGLFSRSTRELDDEILKATQEQQDILQNDRSADA